MTVEQLMADYHWKSAFDEAYGYGIGLRYHDTDDSEPDDNEPPISNVVRVIASADGEPDGDDWIGIFEMQDGSFVCLRAGCDYTGWDCQANGRIETFRTEVEACSEMAWSYKEMLRLGFRNESQDPAHAPTS